MYYAEIMYDMNIYNVNDKLEDVAEDGIWLDYKNHVFLFILKDEIWTKEECRAAGKNVLTVSFVQKSILDLFLVEIDDCFECSDLPFCMKEADEELTASLHDRIDYEYEVVLAGKDGTIQRVRHGAFKHEDSMVLKERLASRLSEDYGADDFAKAYEKNAARYEPYELEQFAVFTERGKH